MCDRLRQAYEKENGIRYDAVLRGRPDLLFESPLPDLSTLDLNYIYVPDFHMYEGCNDRLAIGNPVNMTIYMKKDRRLARLRCRLVPGQSRRTAGNG